ncbi:hypothetical protein LINPERHAP2_LOCUS35865 [Linum perenne]
MLLVLVVE